MLLYAHIRNFQSENSVEYIAWGVALFGQIYKLPGRIGFEITNWIIKGVFDGKRF